MEKEDLTEYSENELSLRVFNLESLYNIRRQKNLFELLDEYFIYTEKQKEVLKEDLDNDLKENN
jgi:hypothetical protein